MSDDNSYPRRTIGSVTNASCRADLLESSPCVVPSDTAWYWAELRQLERNTLLPSAVYYGTMPDREDATVK